MRIKSIIYFIFLAHLVITFGDVTQIKEAEHHHEDAEEADEEFLEDEKEDIPVLSEAQSTATVRSLHKKKTRPLETIAIHVAPVMPPPPPPVEYEPQRIIKEYTCPQSMTLVGRDCVGRHAIAPSRFCPPNSQLVGDQCISRMRPLIECPPGHFLRHNRCVITDVFSADLTCPGVGETLDTTSGGHCCIRTIPEPPRCPAGFKMTSDGQCENAVSSVMECPEGFQLSHRNRECFRNSLTPATIICPEGAVLDHNTQKCTITRQAPPRCPKRYTFCPELDRCAQRVHEVPGPCPEGFTRIGLNCERTEKLAAEGYCFDGYTLDGTVCTREVPVPPKCPAGYQFSRHADNSCDKMVPNIPKCPPGTTLKETGRSGPQCERTVEHDLTQCCPSGFELIQNQCERIETLPAKLSCASECYRIRTTPIAYACPEGTRFADDVHAPTCVKEVKTEECKPNTSVSASSKCYNLSNDDNPSSVLREGRSLTGETSSASQRAMANCEAAVVCNPRTHVETIVAQAYCPEGGEVQGSVCITKEPIIPQRVCDKDAVLDPETDQCVKKVYAAVKSECPAGAIRQGMRCVSKEFVAPNLECPDGTLVGQGGCCLQRTPAIQSPPLLESIPASWKCSVGRLGPDGRTCLEMNRIPVEMICPPNSEPNENGGCFITTDLVIPPPIIKSVRPSYLCPNGHSGHGAMCHTIERMEPMMTCPVDSRPAISGNCCIKNAAPFAFPPRIMRSVAVPVCPSGSVPRGTTCLMTRETEPIVRCTDGYMHDGNNCVQSTPMQIVCPAGTIQTGDECHKDIVIPPITRIVQGCVHNVVTPCASCPRTVSSSCHRL